MPEGDELHERGDEESGPPLSSPITSDWLKSILASPALEALKSVDAIAKSHAPLLSDVTRLADHLSQQQAPIRRAADALSGFAALQGATQAWLRPFQEALAQQVLAIENWRVVNPEDLFGSLKTLPLPEANLVSEISRLRSEAVGALAGTDHATRERLEPVLNQVAEIEQHPSLDSDQEGPSERNDQAVAPQRLTRGEVTSIMISSVMLLLVFLANQDAIMEQAQENAEAAAGAARLIFDYASAVLAQLLKGS